MTPTQQRRQREKENLRRAILDAARELFISEGYDNVSMRKIAEKIEYSPTTIYLHFQDKSEILKALCDEGFLLMAACLEGVNSIEDPVERLREGGFRYIQFAKQQPQYYVIMFEMQDNALEMDMAKKTESAGYRCFSFMMRCILEGIDQRIITPSAHPLVLTHSIWAGVHGAASLTLSGRLGMLPQELHQAFYDNLLELSIRGLTAPAPTNSN
jgi:AcrR family transcriptional regulator